MVVGLSALKDGQSFSGCPLHSSWPFGFFFQVSLPPSPPLVSSLGLQAALAALTDCCLQPGHCSCSSKDPCRPHGGQAGAPGRGPGRPGTKKPAQNEGQEGEDSVYLNPPWRGHGIESRQQGRHEGISSPRQPKCRGLAEGCARRRGRSEVTAVNTVHVAQWQITCNKCTVTLQSSECTRASL